MTEVDINRFNFGMGIFASFPPEEFRRHTYADVQRIVNTVYPALCDMGFFKETKFRGLYVSFRLLYEDKDKMPSGMKDLTPYSITYKHLKSTGTLDVYMNVPYAFMQQGMKDYVSFMIQMLTEVLQHVSQKFKLDLAPVHQLTEQFGMLSRTATVIERPEVIPVEECLVYVKMTSRPLANEILLESLNYEFGKVLSSTQNGVYLGWEKSEEFEDVETFTCQGPSANEIYMLLRPLLSDLPPGSYVELVTEEGRQRIDIT